MLGWVGTAAGRGSEREIQLDVAAQNEKRWGCLAGIGVEVDGKDERNF